MLTSEAISPDKIEKKDIHASSSYVLGKALELKSDQQGVALSAENGLLVVQVLQAGIVRIKLFTGQGVLGKLDMKSTVAVVMKAKASDTSSVSDYTASEDVSAFIIETGELRIEIAKTDCAICFKDCSGRILTGLVSLTWTEEKAVTGKWSASADTHYYGLGEKTGALDKSGERYEMWNSDVYAPHVPEIEALYQSIPFLLVHQREQAYGIFLDNPGRTFFDMRSVKDVFTLQSETGSFDIYFVYGPGMKQVVSRYTLLTGRMELPPQWAIGYHQSRYSYMSQDEVLELAHTFREKQIPCDVICLDIHYMEGYRVFTFDPERFPDPRGMIEELKLMGIRIVPIVDPGVKLDLQYSVFKEGAAGGYYCQKQNGEPFVGPVWPGMSVFPDFTEDQVSEWWGDLHKFYTELGIEGIWNDMNEPAVFNESKTMDIDTLHGNNGSPVSHGEIHNLYGLLMSKATSEGLTRNLGGNRPFVLTRAGYAGVQRYAAVWTGDNRSFWEHMALAMPMVLNLGLSGVAFAGPDIGGFAHHSSGELLARWTQMGALFPYCRNHSELRSIRQEPWSFGPDIEAVCRKYIELRYRLMPLIYSVFRESAETGLPIIRPLVLEYPDDPCTMNLCDQFLLGNQLLAAPIYRPGTDHRSVYLPEGTWYDYWTGEKLAGGRYVLAYAPLDTMPLYVKAGSVIPQIEPANSTMQMDTSLMEIDVYCSGSDSSKFELYEDDRLTFDYKGGVYNLFKFELEQAQDTTELRIETLHSGFGGGSANWRINLKNLPSVPRLIMGVNEIWNYDTNLGDLTLVIAPPTDVITLVIHY